MIDLKIFQNKKVFITGHTGFKGSWLLCYLHRLGANIIGYALTPKTKEDIYYTINGDSLCHSIIADIRDKDRLEKEILNFQPDFVFHLAAQPLVRLSYQIPSYTFEVNTLGTSFVLDALRKLEKKCVAIMITTDKVYENKEWLYPYRETDILGGYDPYSASKAAAELIISSYRNSFFKPTEFEKHFKSIASVRAGNVIGGGDFSTDRIIPDIVKALNLNAPIEIRNPMAIRPWQHVLEPIHGYVLLASKMYEEPSKFADSWNFGPHIADNLTVENVVKKAIQVWGSGSFKNLNLINQPHEAGLLKLDISKAVNELKWYPKWSAKEAIEYTINWYKAHPTKRAEVTYHQIENYLS